MNWFPRILTKLFGHKSNKIGDEGERLAAAHLRDQGHRIRARNWKCPIGEVDVISEQGELLIFVEVKTSKVQHDIRPELRVHSRKQAKLRALAEYYVKVERISRPCRFDVISVYWEKNIPQIKHIENAF